MSGDDGVTGASAGTTTGIVLFDGVEELDFAGPWEVFTFAALMAEGDRVLTVAERDEPVNCAKGLRVLPDATFANAPELDVLLVPGGQGTRTEVENPAMIEWLRKVAPGCRWVTSVCTGSLLLHEAGPARGKRVTTHWGFAAKLAERDEIEVVPDERIVVDGNVVTSAGVSAGIDMALWLVGEIHGAEMAANVTAGIQYDPQPPYPFALPVT
ncbi:MAG: DJ-1/PfpI family protein [Solirubrobacterales bacterium]